MTFSFFATPDFDFITQFAQHLQVPVHNDHFLLPEHLGQGYVRKLLLGADFKLIIHRYDLREDLVIKRQAFGGVTTRLLASFTTTSSRWVSITPTIRRSGFPNATIRPFSLRPTI